MNSATIITTVCSNCGKVAELGKPIPVVAEDGSTFEIAICDSEACQTNCIPTNPSDFFTLQSGLKIRWAIGTCDECELEYSTDELIAGKTEGDCTPWYCAFCAARQQHDDTTTKVLLELLKGDRHMMTVTRDGITTIEPMLTSIEFTLTGNLSHEFVVWDDGSFTIDGLEDVGVSGVDHVHLDLAGLRTLRDFLNSTRITTLLNS